MSTRIEQLDVTRGLAVLGILVMNVQSFSMNDSAYFNPTAYGDFGGLNYAIWWVSHVLADGKFMSIFSMLFGAGIALLSDRCAATGRSPRRVHYRRLLGLLCFGMIHAYAFWSGDILVMYAVTAGLIFWCRNLDVRTLSGLALLMLAVSIVASIFYGWSMQHWNVRDLAELQLFWQPDVELIDADLAMYRGTWLDQTPTRIADSLWMQLWVFPTGLFWRIAGLMLLGMSLFRSGFFSGGWSTSAYWRCLAIGISVGFPLIVWGVWRHEVSGWSMEAGIFYGRLPNDVGSIFVALAYMSAVALFCRASGFRAAKHALSSVGKLALTNYLGQTLICTTLFYGQGLGWYGSVPRTEQAMLVVCIWAAQIAFSVVWLRRNRIGPLESLWRRMTYAAVTSRRLD